LEVAVQYFNQTAARITVTHIPAKEPLGAIRLRLRLRPEAGAQAMAAVSAEPGPWSQVRPEMRWTGNDVTLWALAPSLGESLIGESRMIAHVDVNLAPTRTLAAAADLIDSVILEEAFGPTGKKAAPDTRLTLGLGAPRGPLMGSLVEKTAGDSRFLTFTLGKAQRVRVHVSDVRGRRVANVFDGKLGPGMHELQWNGKAEGGKAMAPGVYSLRLEAGTYVYDRKLEVKP
jgi:flagellar hook capping protein FlgD